jgi:hypothetical protein
LDARVVAPDRAPPVRAAVVLASAPFAAVVRCEVPEAAVARRVGAPLPRAEDVSASGWRMPPVAPTRFADFLAPCPGKLPRAFAAPAFFAAIARLRLHADAPRGSTGCIHDG